jgi:hypothetical protein
MFPSFPKHSPLPYTPERRLKRLSVPTDILTPGRDYGFRVPVRGLPEDHRLKGRCDNSSGSTDIDVESALYRPVPLGEPVPNIERHLERDREGEVLEVICRPEPDGAGGGGGDEA